MDNGKVSLFKEIIKNNKLRILRICRAYTREDEDQKDLFQDVMLNIWKSLPSYSRRSGIDTWVYRVCLNVCMQYAMKAGKADKIRPVIDGIYF